jgi:hypothetical protein
MNKVLDDALAPEPDDPRGSPSSDREEGQVRGQVDWLQRG